MLPILYLRGISTGDFQEALQALLGKDALSLSPSVISPKNQWQAVLALAEARLVGAALTGPTASSCRAPDGRSQRVHAGFETPEGKMELIGFQIGVRESA